MSDNCCGPAKNGNAACGLPATKARPAGTANVCPACDQVGKIVQGQTVKSLLAVSLREVRDEVDYLFCRTQTCPVVYFTPDGTQTFTTAQVRERVYQKEPDADDVFVCYCFRHTVGDIRATSPQQRSAMLDDINIGIQVGQCACDLRNPQGACCLGNVRSVIKQVERAQVAITMAH